MVEVHGLGRPSMAAALGLGGPIMGGPSLDKTHYRTCVAYAINM